MVSTKASSVKRLRRCRNRALLDEKRLRVIKKRIAAGYYNKREVRRTIAERIAGRLLEEGSGEER